MVVSVFDSTEFTGAGTVVDLHFKVIGQIGSSTPLTLTNFLYNGGLVCSNVTSGTLTVISGTVAGRVTLENEAYPVPAVTPVPVHDAKISAAGGINFFALSDANGDYGLSGFSSGAYTVTPSRPDEDMMAPNGIFSDDASLVAQHVVQLITLSPTQLRAADVSGLGQVSSYDAALIAQWVVGIPNPANQAGKWQFTPASTTPDVREDSSQNYLALLMGDINGDWSPAGPRQARTTGIIDPGTAVRVSISDLAAGRGTQVTVPLRIENLRGRGITSYQFDIEYDPAVLTPADIAADLAGTISQGLSVVSNSPRPGLLKVAVYGAVPVTGDGVLIDLRFIAAGRTGNSSRLTISGFRFNDQTDGVIPTSGRLDITGP